MAITNYAELQQQIADYTHRADLTSKIPDFIRLAEDIIYGDLDVRQLDLSTTLTCTALTESVAVPSDFIQARSLNLTSVTPQMPLEYLTPEQYNQSFQYSQTGRPIAYTFIGSNIFMRPIPDSNYTLGLVYTARLINLSVANATNFLLTNFPAVYLYATMVQASLYIKTDFNVWQEGYVKAMQGVNLNDWMNASNLQVTQDINLVSGAR